METQKIEIQINIHCQGCRKDLKIISCSRGENIYDYKVEVCPRCGKKDD
jgi:hypothetical protein